MTASLATTFKVEETHGILWRPENEIHSRSDELGWSSMYASVQREAPYEDHYDAVNDHLIVLHLDGPVSVARRLGHNEAKRVIAPGGLFMLPGGMDFGVRLEGSLNSLHLYLRRYVVEEVADDLGLDPSAGAELIPRFGDQDPLIERLAMAVREALTDDSLSSAMYVDYLARALAAHLLRRHSAAAEPWLAGPAGALSRGQIERVVDYMEANLAEPIRLEDLAAALGLSASHFARRFKSTTGMPPHQYLMGLRVERAKRLLLSNEAIIEVALSCGFTHQEHLTRIFRRFTGMTPGAYRRTNLSALSCKTAARFVQDARQGAGQWFALTL